MSRKFIPGSHNIDICVYHPSFGACRERCSSTREHDQAITTRDKSRGHTKIQLLLNRIYMTLIAQVQGKSDAVMAQTTVLAISYFKH